MEAPVAEAGLAGIAVVVLAIVVLIFLPYVFFILELLVLPLLFGYRVIFDKPWTVEATSGSQRQRWQVPGWRRAGEAAADIARSREEGNEAYEPLGAEGPDPPRLDHAAPEPTLALTRLRQPWLRSSAESGLVLATQQRGCIT